MGLIDDAFTRYQEVGSAAIGVNPMGTSAEIITTSKKVYKAELIQETRGGFQQGVGEGIGSGFEAWGEGIGYGYGKIATGIGSNIVPLGLLSLGVIVIAKKL